MKITKCDRCTCEIERSIDYNLCLSCHVPTKQTPPNPLDEIIKYIKALEKGVEPEKYWQNGYNSALAMILQQANYLKNQSHQEK